MNEQLESMQARDEHFLCKTYNRYPVTISHGQGSRLYDMDEKEYIDLLSGIAVTNLGQCNEEIAQVITKQARKLIHVSNLFYQEEQLVLAERLLSTCHLDKAFFCNSGAEANEAAIKLARRYMQKVRNTDAYEIITLSSAFHGRTLATVAATGQAKFQDGFMPMPEGFVHVEWGNLEALRAAITPHTAGILVEIIQGEGGVRPMSKAFAQGIEALCREKKILFMVDEVQTGMCRSGKFWAFQHFDLHPDIVSCAKALANGLPMGGIMATREVAQAFVAGSHATTFGASALCSAVAATVIEIMQRDNLAERAQTLGQRAMQRFREIGQRHPGTIREVRGMGLLIGIVLENKGKAVWEELLKRGFLLNLTQEYVLRLLPALTIDEGDLIQFANVLEDVLVQHAGAHA